MECVDANSFFSLWVPNSKRLGFQRNGYSLWFWVSNRGENALFALACRRMCRWHTRSQTHDLCKHKSSVLSLFRPWVVQWSCITGGARGKSNPATHLLSFVSLAASQKAQQYFFQRNCAVPPKQPFPVSAARPHNCRPGGSKKGSKSLCC